MGLKGKLERDLNLESDATKYYMIWRKEAHKLPNIDPNNVIKGVDLHEGDWDSHGAVKTWTFTIEGKTETIKEKVEFDDANLSITFNGFEGHAFQQYKAFKAICKLIPRDQGCTAKLIVEYEKLKEDVPDPDKYMDIFVTLNKEIDAHVSAGA